MNKTFDSLLDVVYSFCKWVVGKSRHYREKVGIILKIRNCDHVTIDMTMSDSIFNKLLNEVSEAHANYYTLLINSGVNTESRFKESEMITAKMLS